MTAGQRLKRFARNEFLGGLPFEFDAMETVFCHGLHPLKARQLRSIPKCNLSTVRGAIQDPPAQKVEIAHRNTGEIFYMLREDKILIESWRLPYNMIRPPASLGYKPPTPEVFMPSCATCDTRLGSLDIFENDASFLHHEPVRIGHLEATGFAPKQRRPQQSFEMPCLRAQ